MKLSTDFPKLNLWHCVAFVLALHMFTMPFVVYPTAVDKGPSWLGLDISWQMTLNHAVVKNWTWGKDIIYTYGPLGFLATRIGLGVSRWVYVLFDLFLIANFFFLFKDFILTAYNKALAAITILVFTLILSPFHGGDIGWVLLIFIYYWLYKAYQAPRFSYFIMLSLLIACCFFIKLNAGLIGIIFLAAALVNSLVFKKIKLLPAVIALAMALAMIAVGAMLLHVSLPGYTRGAIEIIRGYNDVMFFTDQTNFGMEKNLNILFLIITSLLAAYGIFLLKEKKTSQLYFIAISIVYIYLLRKQSFVRNDIQHLSEFFYYAPLVLLFGNLLHTERVQRVTLGAITMTGVIALLFITETRPLLRAFDARFTQHEEYFELLKNYNSKPFVYQKDKRHIPQRILDKIGNQTVDVFPWDSEYIIENNLNYHPRPVFQSFSAYTPYLQEANYEFYRSKGPKYIIYDYDGIDSRLPFNDEPLLNMYLARNYVVTDTFTSNERSRLLLERKDVTVPADLVKTGDQKASINQEIPVNGAAVIKINIDYTFTGKLKSTWRHPSEVKVAFMTEDGVWRSFRTSRELLRGGIMTEKLVLNLEDFMLYVTDRNALPAIGKLKIESDKKYCKEEINVEYYSVK